MFVLFLYKNDTYICLMHVGLFFGSFNPIHIGHMAIANYMAEFTDLDQVWFVVSPQNPLKDKASLLDQHQRLHMVDLAIGDNSKFKSSSIEFNLPKPSFTINTLEHLKEKYPKKTFSIIIGEDNLAAFPKWKNYEEILKKHKLYVYLRPNSKSSDLNKHPNVIMTDSPLMDISSTFIRQAIKNKKDVSFFMPFNAYNYLDEMHFYKK